ncbi:class F sortase [Streptomyces sp. C1-2]|uniref:class F sortase n=1 Tax=Streptomyces sp. C1-2 TaxID=2720022 RepID=UPI00143236DF|nr:class F sortase [Streptomyces sp. C1-2]NJP72615.1 class F sortase [Streptomyces sp. C1-2]
MVPRRRGRRPWRRTRAYRLARTAVLAVVLVAVSLRCVEGHRERHPEARSAASRVPSAGSSARGHPAAGPSSSPDASPPPAPLPRSPATAVRIPDLGVDAPIVPVRLDAHRQLGTPPVDRPKLIGWYADGPSPGEAGTAVAVGHRDTRTGPAVFAALGQLDPGDHVEARRTDGRTAVYTVDRVRTFDKDHFPDKEVYGTSKRPELRVLTCGGLYRGKAGYTSNIVVFAHLTATRGG